MNVEERPHTMSSAMEVVKPHLPERGSRHGLQTVAIDLGGEDSRAQSDYTLQDACKALLQQGTNKQCATGCLLQAQTAANNLA